MEGRDYMPDGDTDCFYIKICDYIEYYEGAYKAISHYYEGNISDFPEYILDNKKEFNEWVKDQYEKDLKKREDARNK
jgi:hypothetical protein